MYRHIIDPKLLRKTTMERYSDDRLPGDRPTLVKQTSVTSRYLDELLDENKNLREENERLQKELLYIQTEILKVDSYSHHTYS